MPDNNPRRRIKKFPRRKTNYAADGSRLPRERRPMVERLQDAGVIAVVLGWATAGLSNRDISLKLGCTERALDHCLAANRALARRFWRARQAIKEEAIQELRLKFKRDWRACAFYLERRHRDEYGTNNANAVDLRKLFGLLSKLAASIADAVPEANRAAVDALVADFIDKLSQDEGDEPEGMPE